MHTPKQPKLIKISDVDTFQGWDSGVASDVAIGFEYIHAWKEHHQKYSCPLKINPQIFQPAKNFCERIFLPFRWYVRWCIKLLGKFPQPWELNYKWIQKEVEEEWLEVRHTKVIAEVDHTWQSQRILAVHKE